MKRPSGLLGSIATFTSWTMASRCFGLLRDILIVSSLGAGWRFDAFAIALKIPNTFRSFTAEGALTSAFVPVFTREHKQYGPDQARTFFGQVLVTVCIGLSLICVFATLNPDIFVVIFAPGLEREGKTFLLAQDLVRITFPYIALISATAIFGGVLSANGRFAAFAATSVIFNLCLIVATLLAIWLKMSLTHFLAWAVSISGLLQLALVMVAAFKSDMMPKLSLVRHSAAFKDFLRAFGPALFGASVIQINSVVDLMIASTLEAGSISILFVADRLYLLPIGLIGASLGVTILPLLANRISGRNHESANGVLNDGIVFSALLAMPAACGLIVLALPIFRLLFEYGDFSRADSEKAAMALQILATCLPVAIVNKCLVARFYASRDTTRPAWIAAIAVVINAGVSYSLSLSYGYVGVVIGTSLSIWSQAGLFVISLWRLGRFQLSFETLKLLLKIGGISAIMGVALLGLEVFLPIKGPESVWEAKWVLAGALGLHIAFGVGLYGLLAYRLGFFSLLVRMRKTSIVQN